MTGRAILPIIVCGLLAWPALGARPGAGALSARRAPGTSWKIAAGGAHPAQPIARIEPAEGFTPEERAVRVGHLDTSGVPELSPGELARAFAAVRDERVWAWQRVPGFLRRIPWLYAEDGCFLRAELATLALESMGFAPPRQLFVFGNFSGSALFQRFSWWFHVAPVYRTGHTLRVLDPALEPRHPLKLSEWVARMHPHAEDGDDGSVRAALCGPYATAPDGDCQAAGRLWNNQDLYRSQQTYLDEEWWLLANRDPEHSADLLGDEPPWKKKP